MKKEQKEQGPKKACVHAFLGVVGQKMLLPTLTGESVEEIGKGLRDDKESIPDAQSQPRRQREHSVVSSVQLPLSLSKKKW